MKFKIVEEITGTDGQYTHEFMKTHCQQFIKEANGGKLYRGIKIKNEPDFFIATPKPKRKPIDVKIEYHRLLDKLFFNKFGWKARSEGTFCRGTNRVGYYGIVYEIYPTNRYKYIWSPKVGDLYETYVNWERVYNNNHPDHYATIEDVKDFLIRDVLDTYQDTDLAGAIKSGNEIMLLCDEYVGMKI
jgi:hypothetical protein